MALSAFACSANAADNHSNKINVKTGSQFKIELKSNPTTGYSWILRKLPDNVAYVGSQYDEDSTCQSKKLLGCGGKTIMHFIAVSSGLSQIELQYAQPWEPLPKEKTIYNIHVE